MNKFQNLLWALMIASPTIAMAQPPEEELSPTAPEFNIEVMDAPPPTEAPVVTAPAAPAPATTGNAQLQPVLNAIPMAPVAEPKKLEQVKEDSAQQGIKLEPSITVKPLGYNGEPHQSYFELSPTIGLGSVFKTAQKRDVSLNISYTFIWDEFFSRRENGLRYFEHDLNADATIDWSKSFATKMTNEFDYSLRASTTREFAIYNESYVNAIFKVIPELSITTGYHLFYFNDLDSQFHLSDGTLPSDGDDIRQGNSAISGSGGDFYTDPNSPNFNYDPTVGNQWFANNGFGLATSYKVIPETTLSAHYEYVFATFTNDDVANWRGHWFDATIAQKLPWKDGTVSLKDQVRLRNYRYKLNDDGSNVSNFRNRLTLTIGQGITDAITAEFWYRWQLSGSNADNYDDMEGQHQLYLGFTFGF